MDNTESLTYSLEEAAAKIGGKCTARWLADKIRERQIPAVRVVRELRMTDENIREALTLLAVESSDGLTSRSRKRLNRRAS